MPIRRPMFVVFIVSIILALSLVPAAQAQDQVKTCPMVVSESLTALGTNCANLSRNSSCLGHEEVQHTSFVGIVPSDFYTNPGDRAALTEVETIQTGAFNLPQELWGLNVMNVDANVPLGFSQKGVIFIQFGGVEVENGVEPPDAVQLVNGINATTSADTDLLTWPPPSVPGHASETMLSVPAGSSVSIDAVSPTADYGRAVFQNNVGWISMAAITSNFDFSGLPVIGVDDMTPMQNFYFRTGIGGTSCDEAPSLLFIQGPDNVAVDVEVFEQPVRIQSTIILRSLPPGDQLGNQLELIVLSGLAILYPDTPQQIIVPPGYKSIIPLCSEFASLGIEGDADEKAACGSWGTPIPLTSDELAELDPLEDLPGNVTNYDIEIPIVVTCSGNPPGNCVSQLFFPNQAALNEAIAACEAGELSEEICQYLGVF